MRSVVLLAVVSCAAAPRAPLVVPVRVACGADVEQGWGRVVGADLVEADAHVARCADGLPRGGMLAGGVPVVIERYDGGHVLLRAQGALTLYDVAGRPVCMVDAAIDSGYVRCVELPGWTMDIEPARGRRRTP